MGMWHPPAGGRVWCGVEHRVPWITLNQTHINSACTIPRWRSHIVFCYFGHQQHRKVLQAKCHQQNFPIFPFLTKTSKSQGQKGTKNIGSEATVVATTLPHWMLYDTSAWARTACIGCQTVVVFSLFPNPKAVTDPCASFDGWRWSFFV